MLSVSDIARIRQAQADALPDSALVYRRSMMGDGQGGQAEHWSEPISVSCRLRPMATEDVARYADKMTAAGGWVITLPHDTDVAAFDRITVGGVDYRVVGTQVGESWLSAVRAYCERIS